MPCLQDIPDDTVPVTAFLKELLGLATAQRPLLIFFDSIDELTGSQVCDKLSEGALWLCRCLTPLFFYSSTQLISLQALRYVTTFLKELLSIPTAQSHLFLYALTQSMSLQALS